MTDRGRPIMQLLTLECKKCGGAIEYAAGATHLKCKYCGTEYILKRDTAAENGLQEIDYLGRGALFRACLPEGWSVRVFDDSQSFSRQAAICRGLRLDSPGGAQLIFYPFAYFKSFDPNGLLGGLQKNYAFDPVTMLRRRALPSMEDYVAQRFAEMCPQGTDLRIRQVGDLDASLQRITSNFAAQSGDKIGGELEMRWGKYELSYTLNGAATGALFATAAVFRKDAEKAQAPAREPAQAPDAGDGTSNVGDALKKFISFGMGGGIIGAKRRGETVNLPHINLPQTGLSGLGQLGNMAGPDWGRCFDVLIVAGNETVASLNTIFNDFCESIQYGALYYALQDEELRQTERIVLDGARQRQQNAYAASQRLRQTMNETSDIITRGYEQRSAVMDDISRKQSEAVRGVNTYTDTYGRQVEADVKYERVFQRGSVYAGTQEAGYDPGADWVELHRK